MGLLSSENVQLENSIASLIYDARAQYIMGFIDDAAFDKAVETWLSSGGQQAAVMLLKVHRCGDNLYVLRGQIHVEVRRKRGGFSHPVFFQKEKQHFVQNFRIV